MYIYCNNITYLALNKNISLYILDFNHNNDLYKCRLYTAKLNSEHLKFPVCRPTFRSDAPFLTSETSFLAGYPAKSVFGTTLVLTTLCVIFSFFFF